MNGPLRRRPVAGQRPTVSRRIAVAASCEQGRSPVAPRRLEAVVRGVLRAERVRHALISIALVSNARIAALNALHLKHPGPTDVLAFGFARGRGAPLIGDIYIAPDVARANARRHGVGVREEVARLAVHGVLHLLGYDHPDGVARERSAMWRRQEVLLARSLRIMAA